MKKNSILITAFILGASLAQAQTPSGQTAPVPGQTVPPTVAPGLPQTQPGGIPPAVAGAPGVAQPVNPAQTQPRFGGTNPPTFGTTNQVGFGGTNGAVPFSTNVPPSAVAATTNGSVIVDQSGAARQSGAGLNASDQAFVQRLQAALARSGATQVFFPQTRSTIQVMSQNGTVTLQGVVSSEAEKQSIETRVRAMQGVTAINNQLQVSANPVPPGGPATPVPGSDRRLLTP